jgi:hypothetical protein
MIKKFKQFVLENIAIDKTVPGQQAQNPTSKEKHKVLKLDRADNVGSQAENKIKVIEIENTYDEDNNIIDSNREEFHMSISEIVNRIQELSATPVFISDFNDIPYNELDLDKIDKNTIWLTPAYSTDEFPEHETEKTIQPQFITDEQSLEVVKILKMNSNTEDYPKIN